MIDLGKVDVDFAASLVAASKGSAAPVDDEPEVDEDDSADDEADSADEDSDDAADADNADDDADSDEDSEDEDDGADAGDGADLEAIGQLFVAGDLAAACKALGIDPKVLKVNGPKLIAMRKGLAEANAKSAAAEQATKANAAEKSRLDAVLADAKRRFGPLVDLQNAIGLADFGSVQELLLALAPKGTSWEQLKTGLDAAGKAVTPELLAAKRELKRLKDEQAALEATKTQSQTAEQETALAKKNLDGATARLKGTDFDGIAGAPEAMVRIISENWDFTRGGLKCKPEEILKKLGEDPVISQLIELKKLKAKGGKPGKEAKPKVRVRGRGVVANQKVDAKAAREKELRASMVEAERAEKASQRRGQRGHRGLR